MQIENHKEEVPFEYYAELFSKADAKEMAARSGAEFDGEKFYVNLLGVEYAITHPQYSIEISLPCVRGGAPEGRRGCDNPSVSCADSPAVPAPPLSALRTFPPLPGESALCTREPLGVALPVQTFLLRYLLEGKEVHWQGNWKTFREMPWGELYIKPYTGRVLTRAAFTFGFKLEKFKAACEKMGATPLKHGDAGYEFAFLGRFRMQIMIWEGDDEFPPNAQVLYTDNFETGFAPEDRVVAGDILITAIKSNM